MSPKTWNTNPETQETQIQKNANPETQEQIQKQNSFFNGHYVEIYWFPGMDGCRNTNFFLICPVLGVFNGTRELQQVQQQLLQVLHVIIIIFTVWSVLYVFGQLHCAFYIGIAIRCILKCSFHNICFNLSQGLLGSVLFK